MSTVLAPEAINKQDRQVGTRRAHRTWGEAQTTDEQSCMGGKMAPHLTGAVSLAGACRQGERVADGDRIEDEALIDQCRRGDRTAFNALMRRHYPRVHAVARRLS